MSSSMDGTGNTTFRARRPVLLPRYCSDGSLRRAQKQGYKWIAIDSLTEMSDRCMAELRVGSSTPTDMRKQDYERQMIVR